MADYVWTYTAPDGGTVSFGDGQLAEVLQISGLDGFDNVRSSTTDIPRGHGGVPGKHFLPPRAPVFRLEAIEATQAGLESTRQQLVDGLTVSTDVAGTLQWERPGQAARLMFCRPVSVVWPTDSREIGLAAEPRVAFEAADPRMYAAAGKTVRLEPYTAGGGLDFTVEYAKEFTVTGLDKAASNGGNVGCPPVVRFYGPTSGTCTGVQLLNRTTGVTLDVQTSITAGQTLTVDMRAFVASTGARVVDLSGASRYGDWQQPRTPLLIEPGSNVLRFTGDGTTTGMECVVDFADTWLS